MYSWHTKIVQRAQEMLRVRHFEVIDGQPEPVAPNVPFKTGLTSGIKDGTRAGGYAVMFWSKQAKSSEWMMAEHIMGYWAAEHRILLALLDDTPIPEWARLMDVEAVQIYPDAEPSMAQRIDDLIVRLYWLIYRNTRQNQLG